MICTLRVRDIRLSASDICPRGMRYVFLRKTLWKKVVSSRRLFIFNVWRGRQTYHICEANISLRSNITCPVGANIAVGCPYGQPTFRCFFRFAGERRGLAEANCLPYYIQKRKCFTIHFGCDRIALRHKSNIWFMLRVHFYFIAKRNTL